MWKLEPQKRGAPHFHLLLCLKGSYSDDVLNDLRKFIALAWYEIVGSSQPTHLMAGTSVEPVETWNGVKHYTSKYLAKEFDGNEVPEWWDCGRFWGVVGKIPTDIHEVRLSQKQFYAIRRLAYRHLRSISRDSAHRPKIWSPDSGVCMYWSDKTALQVLAWSNTIAYDEHNGTHQRKTDCKHNLPPDTAGVGANGAGSRASRDAPHAVCSALCFDRVA